MLYIVKNIYFLSDFIMEALDDQPNVAVITPEKISRRRLWKLWRVAETYMTPRRRKTSFFTKEFTDQLSKITAEDNVLFFGEESLWELMIYSKLTVAKSKFVWIWNSLAAFHRSHEKRMRFARRVCKAGLQPYTFDPSDAAEYGLQLTDQVYRNVDKYIDRETKPDIDLFFVGVDKGRAGKLTELKNAADEAGMTSYFHILPDKSSAPGGELLRSEKMSYDRTISYINRSRCLVEMLQSGQNGMSVRALEALFFGKKLITDNAAMAKADFYHPDNIFILGHDDPAALRQFIDRPAHAIDAEVKNRYDICHWIKQFEV